MRALRRAGSVARRKPLQSSAFAEWKMGALWVLWRLYGAGGGGDAGGCACAEGETRQVVVVEVDAM
jgi:hypothetical protein